MRATIFRQTMFAEFEKLAHQSAESGEPLTLERFKEIYRGLLRQYFGPDFVLDDELGLECLRIPHFYRAFYVYKYATGMSAAISLAERVTSGGQRELDDYLNFLKGGCSKDPLDLLRDAGVDMEQPAAVDGALEQFGKLVEELDALCRKRAAHPCVSNSSSASGNGRAASGSMTRMRPPLALQEACEVNEPGGADPKRDQRPAPEQALAEIMNAQPGQAQGQQRRA